jgi:hypothetical protein
MITISAFKDREEALISKALLEAAGVPVTLRDEYGELQLQVRDTDAQLAHDVLTGEEPAGWRGRNSKANLPRLQRRRPGRGLGRQFFKGGGLVVVAFLLLLLLLMPLGVGARATPFMLFFLFMFGGCTAVVLKSFRIRQKRVYRRRRRVE